ncbi:MAG: DNA mismatch repair endonuclease MutL [Treponema sp.]|nr:DNA mismatch repair endonuclease MutL [Treponema sp.]
MSLQHRIKVLSPEVARKIAAGEVIDRPNAIIRELMDNAIDSGADSITVEVTDGGIEKIRVVDNGSGMTKEDLEIASTPHATSKISTEQDLLNLSTLGFRGEALSSIAAVSNLTICSGSWQLEAGVAKKNTVTECTPVNGTIVRSENLFENFPARRIFLKKPATEAKMCLNTFIEKALPFFERDFRFYSDGELKLVLPKTSDLQKRFTDAFSYGTKKDLFYTIENAASDKSWSYKLIIGDPDISRPDRKEISIFVNNRKINEYSLVQAIEYGCQGFFPNGTHPVACLFVTMDPSLVDFNIHPAKREARFKDTAELHHSVSSSTQNFFKNNAVKSLNTSRDSSYYENSFSSDFFESSVAMKKPSYSAVQSRESRSSSGSASSDMRSIFMDRTKTTKEINESYINHLASEATALAAEDSITNSAPSSQDTVKYYGTALGVFLIAEKDDTLYLIDQHAAHERILYNKIISSESMPQKLLVPYEFETESASDDSYLESVADSLSSAGFLIENCGNGKWQINAVHERWSGSEDELVKAIMDDKVAPDKILNHIAATTACKAAIKDGYYLDDKTALELCEKAISLPDPHCPHGRPVWTAITRENLFELVKRT